MSGLDVDRLCFAVQGELMAMGPPSSRPISYNNYGSDENPQNLVLSRAQVGGTDRQPPHAFSRRRENGMASAGASRGTPGSPQPPGGSELSTMWTSILGGHRFMRSTS